MGFVGELLHTDHRPKHFALYKFGILRRPCDHCGCIEIARTINRFAANDNARARSNRSVHHAIDSIALRCRNNRTNVGRRVVRVAGNKRANRRFECSNEIVEHARAGDDTAWRGAVLTGVVITGLGKCCDNRFNIGIVEHHDWCFATKFKMHALQRVGGVARNHLSGVYIAGERQHRNTGVTNNCIARSFALTNNNVEHTCRKNPFGEFCQTKRSKRREFRRLQNKCVANGERGTHFPDRHIQRIVPGSNAGDNAKRIAPQHRGVVIHVFARGLRVHRARCSCEEPKVVDRQVEFEIDNRNRLPNVLAFNGFQLLEILFEAIGQRE